MNSAIASKLSILRKQLDEKEKENEITVDGLGGIGIKGMEGKIPRELFENPYGNSTQGRALEYLGKGLKPSAVATVMNVTPGLISQYLNDPVFKNLVEDRLAIASLAITRRNEKLDELEDIAISKVQETLQWVHKPMEAVAALKAINSLERRNPAMNTDEGISEGSGKVVIIQLPQFMLNTIVNVQMSTDAQIVEVDGREMRTMSSVNVNDMLYKKNKKEMEDKVVSVQENVKEKTDEQYPARLFE